MADENVTIKIDVKADTRGAARVRKSLVAIGVQAKALDEKLGVLANRIKNQISSRLQAFSDKFNQGRGSLQLFSMAAKEAGGTVSSLSRTAGRTANFFKTFFKFAMIGAGAESALLAIALSSVNGFLITGNLLARAWSATINGLAVAAANAAAAVGVLVAVFTQAMRQYSAAQASFAYGGDFVASSSALRNMQADSQLAVFGLQSVTAAFAAASRNTRVTSSTVGSIGGLSDFVVASGDMEKGLTAAAEIVSLLESGKSTGDLKVLDAAKALGPEFEKAFKQASASGAKSSDEILKMFSTGELSAAAGITGTANNVRRTLMGQLKEFAVNIQTTFADLGATFIKPIQEAFNEIRTIILRMTIEIAGTLNNFARGSFINMVVKSIDKLAEWTATLINHWIPRSEEVFNNFINGWNKMTAATGKFFYRFERFLKRYTEASKIVNTFFGAIFKAGFGDGIEKNFKSFSELIIKYRENFLEFGESLGNLVKSIFNLFGELRESFMKSLPAINMFIDGITKLVNVLSGLVSVLGVLGMFGTTFAFLAPFILAGGFTSGLRGGQRPKGVMGMKRRAGIAGVAAAVGGSAYLPDEVQIGKGEINPRQLAQVVVGGAALGGFAAFKILNKFSGAVTHLASTVGTGTKGGQTLAKAAQVATDPKNKKMIIGKAAGATAAVAAAVAITGQVSDLVEKQFGNTAATIGLSALTGAATGAAAGALIGSIVPVFGTAIGAGVGAVVGTVIGTGMGIFNSIANKKRVTKLGAEFGETYMDAATDIIRMGGGMEAYNEFVNEFGSTLDKVSEMHSRDEEFVRGAQKARTEQEKKSAPALEQYIRNMTDLKNITGKSDEEIRNMAHSLKIDLSSNIMAVNEILTETGYVVRRLGDDFNAAFSQDFANAITGLREYLAVLEAPLIMDEAAEDFRQKALADALTDRDIVDFIETLAIQSQAMSGGDSVAAFRYMVNNLGVGGFQFESGGAFEDVDRSILDPFLDPLFAQLRGDLAGLTAENIVSSLAAGGQQLTNMSLFELTEQLQDLPEEVLTRIASDSRRSGFLDVDDAGQRLAGYLGLSSDAIHLAETEEAKFGKAVDKFGNETDKLERGLGLILGEDGFEKAVRQFGHYVQKLLDPDYEIPKGDTLSPRRNIVNSMEQHDRFDMGIAGNRTVTSGLRFDRLGSMSSDHAVGRAYDLTGNNLGLYKTSVLNAGGYADFHGAGGSRHLHVVPPEGPVGDRTTPYMGSMSAGGGSNEFNYNITVNASQGMDEMALANLVAEKIGRTQRMANERR